MSIKVSARARAVPPFLALEMMKKVYHRRDAGGDVLQRAAGQPFVGAPEPVRQALHAEMSKDILGYTEALGLPKLRERISQHYQEKYGISVGAGRIAITTGSSGAFLLSFLACFDPGDRVAIFSPGYPAYRNILAGLGFEVVDMPASRENGFQPTANDLDAMQKAHADKPVSGLIIASPCNPAGSMMSAEHLKSVCDWCTRNGVRLISDEIYHGVSYGKEEKSAAHYSDSAVVINSFSKYCGMPGWRLGWMIMPADIVGPCETLSQSMFICAPHPSQVAGLAAFECEDLFLKQVENYKTNRDILLEELPKAGIEWIAPADGAFYLYADVSPVTNDSRSFCESLLDATGVAITPGEDFDIDRGKSWVRLSYCGATDDVAEAAKRMKGWMQR